MKKIELIIFGFLIVGLLQSCRRHEDMGFPDAELKWIPYKVGDTLKYSDSKDTIYMVVTEFYKTAPSSWTGVVLDIYESIYEGHYYTSKSSLYDYQIKENYVNNSDSYNYCDSKIQITEQGDGFEYPLKIFNPSNYTNDSLRIRYVPDTLIKGIHYNESYVFQKDTVKRKPRISRVIKSSDKGIIEFYDSQLKRKWNLINK